MAFYQPLLAYTAQDCCNVLCRVKKITSENDISALHPTASAEFQQELRDKAGQATPEMPAASSSPDKSEPGLAQQVGPRIYVLGHARSANAWT